MYLPCTSPHIYIYIYIYFFFFEALTCCFHQAWLVVPAVDCPPFFSLLEDNLDPLPVILRFRASDRSRGKKSNFARFLGSNSRKNRPISPEFRGKFQGKLRQKEMGKKRPILWLFSRQISLEIDRFCTDQTSVFNVFFNRGYHLLFQQQYAQEMNQWQSL